MQETTIRVSCDTFHKWLKCATQAVPHFTCRQTQSQVAQERDEPSSGLKTRVTPLSLAARAAFAPILTLVVVRERLPSVVSLWHALLFACTPLSAKNASTMIFASSADLPETPISLVPWPWAVLVRTCALPRFDRVLRERAVVSLATRCSV